MNKLRSSLKKVIVLAAVITISIAGQVDAQQAYPTLHKTIKVKEQTMRAFYMIDITIKDGQKFQEYVDHAKPLVEKFGGGMLIRGRELDSDNKPVEGMEFPSVEIARAWYNSDEYRAIIRIRDAGSISEFTLYETVKPHSMD